MYFGVLNQPPKTIVMNNHLRPRSFSSAIFLFLAVVSTFSLSGCGGTSVDCFPPINLDSVKTHVLAIQTATKMTADFRNARDTFQAKCPGFKENMRFGNAEAFNSDAIRILLQQKDSTGKLAAGLRIYYGLDKITGQVSVILVPIDIHGNDIINLLLVQDKDKQVPGVSPKTQSLTLDNAGGQTIEQGQQCPTLCDNGSSGLGGN
jgi:hypothetical protein